MSKFHGTDHSIGLTRSDTRGVTFTSEPRRAQGVWVRRGSVVLGCLRAARDFGPITPRERNA